MIDALINVGIGAVKPELFLVFATLLLLVYGLYAKLKAGGSFLAVALAVVVLAGYLVIDSHVLFGKSHIISIIVWCLLLTPAILFSSENGKYTTLSIIVIAVISALKVFFEQLDLELGTHVIYIGTFLNGMFVSNAFTVFAKILILLSGGLVLLLSSGFLREDGGRPFEFIILVLFSILGMLLMVSAGNLLSLYMSLEMSSLALYVLASFNRDNAKSNEAGLKYFVLGSLASGMLLFGMSLIYGFAGSINFADLGTLFSAGAPISKGVILGLVLVIVGFCFKLSAVPFHMWTPDVYEGSPTPVTAFFATAPKIAALALFTRVLLEPFAHAVDQWQQVVIFVSLASMLVGALGAIMQTNIKRLLAYSSIGHVGFMLMGLAAGNQAGVQAMLIYLSLYIFMSVGMFGAVLLMRRDGQAVENIKDLSGLSQTNPALAIAISICIFSMAGIPPMAGFFGKFYVVLAAIQANLTWLAVAGVVSSVVACYYYLKIIKTMYFDEPAPAFDKCSDCLVRLVVFIGTAVTMLFFLVPTPLIEAAKISASALVK